MYRRYARYYVLQVDASRAAREIFHVCILEARINFGPMTHLASTRQADVGSGHELLSHTPEMYRMIKLRWVRTSGGWILLFHTISPVSALPMVVSVYCNH